MRTDQFALPALANARRKSLLGDIIEIDDDDDL